MRTRYWSLIAVLIVLVGLFLTGCVAPAAPAEPSGSGEGAAATTEEGGKTKIRATVWVGAPELEALNKMTEEYLKTHPDVEVEWINIQGGGDYGRDKLLTMIAGGDAPDLMMLNTGQFEGLAARDALLPLDDFVSKDNFDTSIFWPAGVEGSKYGGKLYGLPRDLSNVILYYNKDLFDAAKLPYPNEDLDMERPVGECTQAYD